MDSVSPEDIRRRTRSVLPGGFALVLSSAVHAAVLPLIGAAWTTREDPDPAAIEVTLAWMPPPAVDEASPAAADPRVASATPDATAAPPQTTQPPKPKPVARSHPAAPPRAIISSTGAAPAVDSHAAPVADVAPTMASVAPVVIAANPQPARAEMLARYSSELLERLERHKNYPVLSQRRGEEGTITVRLTLAEDGRLLGVEPMGEGPPRLVEASLAAVQEAAPFPPLPAELGSRQAVFSLPITYRLR